MIATRPGEVEAAGFRFPVVGRVPYKGFFDVQAAEREAAALRARGLDVCGPPVAAYSTLGWLDDPVTTPMLQQSDGRLAETVIHELVHATVYAASQADFNESIASFIGEEGRIAFFGARDGPAAEARERRRVDAARAYRAVLEETRQQLERLYDEATVPEYQCRFRWENDSIAFWDNRSTQHYATSDYWPLERIMERATVIGDRPA